MKLAILILGAIVGLFVVHRALVFCEERGWIYYRQARGGAATGAALGAMREIVEPDAQHVVEVQRQEEERRDEEDGEGAGRA